MKINKQQLARYREAAAELQKQLKSKEYKKMPLHLGFVKWWCDARFGPDSELRLTDGKGDGGIDAVVMSEGTTYIVQAKYETVPRVSLVTRGDVDAFDKNVERFTNPLKEREFEQWLSTVRLDLRAEYARIRSGYQVDSSSFRFVFITSKRGDYEPNAPAEIEDIQKITALWELYVEGYTPPTDKINLTLEDAWHVEVEGIRTHVGVADVKDFRREMSVDRNERLFAQNVRTTLTTKVNDSIRDTYEREPNLFWLGNNGIYVVCKKVTASGDIYELTYPSIINGSQTLHAINQSKKKHSCKILVRILEMDVGSQRLLLDTVIRRTNSQNPMQLTNLFAHDGMQLNVARFLDRFKLFYERREKEWQNEKRIVLPDYKSVNIKEVSQWLAVTAAGLGIGSTRSSISGLFEDDSYRKIFGAFDQKPTSEPYIDLSCAVWSGLFVKNVIAMLPANEYRYNARIARLLFVKMFFDAVRRDRRLEGRVERALADHCFGKKHIKGNIVTYFRTKVRDLVSLQKKYQKKEPQVDFSNFFKRNELAGRAYSKVFPSSERKRLSKLLERNFASLLD